MFLYYRHGYMTYNKIFSYLLKTLLKLNNNKGLTGSTLHDWIDYFRSQRVLSEIFSTMTTLLRAVNQRSSCSLPNKIGNRL